MNLAQLPLNPSPGEVQQLLEGHHSYIAVIDLSETNLNEEPGLAFDFAGYGVYLLRKSAPGTVLQVGFDDDYDARVELRPGSMHKLGPIQARRTRAYFSRVNVYIPSTGDTDGYAYLLILGHPEAAFKEDGAVVYEASESNAAVGAATEDLLAATHVTALLQDGRVYVKNTGATSLAEAVIKHGVSSTDLVYLADIGPIPAGETRSYALPAGISWVKVEGKTASGSTTTTVTIHGRLG